MFKARVYRSAQRVFDCKNMQTGEMITATAYGNLLKSSESVVVGDYVRVDKIEETGELCITEVENRKSEIYRLLIRESKRKVTAANCDLLVILTSVSKPNFKRGIIDRFLARAYQWGIQPIVVFNKMDEYKESKLDIYFEAERLKFLDIPCFEISAKNIDYKPRYLKKGLDELIETLKGQTSIFLGQSGVGKSRTINTLTAGQVDLKTKQVNRSGKGSHTTTWSEIIDCPPENPSFYLIDSPGIRSFSLDDIKKDELIECFPDLSELATQCQFTDCKHDESARGCSFSLDNFSEHDLELVRSRLESYQKILEEITLVPEWEKE